MQFSDWKSFSKKQIARTYQTDVVDYQPVIAHLTRIEELKQPDESMFTSESSVPAGQEITTAFVSTAKEESLLQKAPGIIWRPVREGKTEGYMIVYARTDRTGQVRETAKHNSDQPGLESFGMEQALRYKFLEMPLVLHFSSRREDALDSLRRRHEEADDVVRRRHSASDYARRNSGRRPHLRRRDWKDVRHGSSRIGQRRRLALSREEPSLCHFTPFVTNGTATYYKGDVELHTP